jgi:hypothetical protein
MTYPLVEKVSSSVSSCREENHSIHSMDALKWKRKLHLFNSIHFNYILLMCRVNSYKANYRHSTVQIYIGT